MNKKSILFVTNGNAKIGYGHIARVRVISDEFRRNGYNSYYLLPKGCPFASKLSNDPRKIFFADAFHPFFVKPVVEELITEKRIDTIFIDLIEPEYKSFEWLRTQNDQLLLVSITLFLFDLNSRYEHVSFFPGLNRMRKKVFKTKYGDLKLFSGAQYLTFRKEFESLKKKIRKDANRILITMGGSDPSSLSLKVLKAIRRRNTGLELTILLSPIASSYNAVKKLINDFHSNKIRLIEQSNDISKEMVEHDILVINGGLTRYESCLAQTPFIAISLHKEQFEITKALTDLGVGINLGVGKHLSLMQIDDSIKSLLANYDLRCRMSKKMRRLFDHQGAKRIFTKVIEAKAILS